MAADEGKKSSASGKREIPTRVPLSRDGRDGVNSELEGKGETAGREPAVLSQRDNIVIKPEVSKENIFDSRRKGTGHVEKSKVAVIPLSVLLPTLGQLSRLAKGREELIARYDYLREHREGGAEEVSRELFAEEQMLKQVVQWLTLSGRESLS